MIQLPKLQSGGVMLTYHCNHACRHCLYRCSPAHSNDFMSEELIDRVFESLSRERGLSGVHIAGGEATLNWDRLIYAIRSAIRHGVSLDYLETNASWCDDYDTARRGFERLQTAGLDCILISASLFHNEFTPLGKTLSAVTACRDVFGRRGTFVWTPEVLGMMQEGLDPSITHKLNDACRKLGIEVEKGDLWRLHSYLRPGGRAAERLGDGLHRHSPDRFINDSCRSMLTQTNHFHIDPFGNLIAGSCPGISVATIDSLHPQVTEATHPLYTCLHEEGPYAAWQRFAPDFKPEEEGYVGKCHFCLELRKHLVKNQPDQFAELRPRDYYFPET